MKKDTRSTNLWLSFFFNFPVYQGQNLNSVVQMCYHGYILKFFLYAIRPFIGTLLFVTVQDRQMGLIVVIATLLHNAAVGLLFHNTTDEQG